MSGCGPGGKSLGGDNVPAPLAVTVAAVIKPDECIPDLRKPVLGLADQSGYMLPLECRRAALRVVLVVSRGGCRRGDNAVEVTLQGCKPSFGARAFAGQQAPRSRLPGQ